MAKKSYTQMFRDLGKKGGTSADFKALYNKMKGLDDEVIKIDLDKIGGPSLDDVLKRYEKKKGGLVKGGKPKLAKKGWK